MAGARRAKKGYSRKPSSNGHALHLPKALGQLTQKALMGLLAAKHLVPSLEAARRLEEKLREGIRSLSRKLRLVGSKARKLERQIKKLSRV